MKGCLQPIQNLVWRVGGGARRWYAERGHFLRNLPRQSVVAELGVFKGEFTREILNVTRPAKLYLVDVWWTRFGEYYPNWGAYTDHGNLKTRDAYAEVQRVVRDSGFESQVHVHAGDDVAFLDAIPDGHLDWAYVDSSHDYAHTLAELEVLSRKVAGGGVIAGHDWFPEPSHHHHGVYRAVQEFCAKGSGQLWLLDNHRQWAIRNRR